MGGTLQAFSVAMMRKTGLEPFTCGVLLLAAAAANAAQGGGRVLTPSDVVAIKVVHEPDLNTTTRIEPDGTINFPYVGRITAAGMTEDDLARTIEKRLIELKILTGP
jgi:polysaccharide export outer membrane protein